MLKAESQRLLLNPQATDERGNEQQGFVRRGGGGGDGKGPPHRALHPCVESPGHLPWPRLAAATLPPPTPPSQIPPVPCALLRAHQLPTPAARSRAPTRRPRPPPRAHQLLQSAPGRLAPRRTHAPGRADVKARAARSVHVSPRSRRTAAGSHVGRPVRALCRPQPGSADAIARAARSVPVSPRSRRTVGGSHVRRREPLGAGPLPGRSRAVESGRPPTGGPVRSNRERTPFFPSHSVLRTSFRYERGFPLQLPTVPSQV